MQTAGTPCATCGKLVFQAKFENKPVWYPESKYWNPEHKEIYCGAKCGFNKYEERHARAND